MLLLCGYAFLNTAQGLLTGGHALRFGMGIVYAGIARSICFGMLIYLRQRNERIESELFASGVQS